MRKKILTTALLALLLTTLPAEKAYASPIIVKTKANWSVAEAELDQVSGSEDGNTKEIINVVTGNQIVIPESTLNKLAGKNVTLAAQAANGVAISVAGRGLGKVERDLAITIIDEIDSVPDDVSKRSWKILCSVRFFLW